MTSPREPSPSSAPRGVRARARAFFQQEKVKAVYHRLRGGELTPWRAAASVFVGVLVGTTPLYGLHFILVMALCVPLRLDTAVAYVASNVSLPIFAPFINVAEVQLGAWLRTGAFIHLDREDFEARGPVDYALELFLGTLLFSPASAAAAGLVTYAGTLLARRRRLARERLLDGSSDRAAG